MVNEYIVHRVSSVIDYVADMVTVVVGKGTQSVGFVVRRSSYLRKSFAASKTRDN